jgi:UDP-N-acetylglucosamine--N-acetylmuramyl-(pentapeptide) pyrophosphoryl-undecaprenol N-acetylglucosamine transferase
MPLRPNNMAKGTILLAAGGTGGHLFPAEALAHELAARGWQVHLATDDRAERFAGKFPAGHPSDRIVDHRPAEPDCALARLLDDLARRAPGLAVIAQIKPSVVIGFGGYPTCRRSMPRRGAGCRR